jgi:hypothetical protein
MDEFCQQNPGLSCLLLAFIFLFYGWFNFQVSRSKFLKYCSLFLGVVTASYGIAEYGLFFGRFRWLVAAIIFIAGGCFLWRLFRNKP